MDKPTILGSLSVDVNGQATTINIPADDIIANTGRSIENLAVSVAVLENFNGLPEEYRAVIQSMGADITRLSDYLSGLKGTVPVDRGGTNATTPAEARANLEITPANIGALPTNNTALTGNPTVPTQSQSQNNTRIASTAFVHQAVEAGLSTAVRFVPKQ